MTKQERDHVWIPQNNVNLQTMNTLALPVLARNYCQIRQLEDLAAARHYCQLHNLPWLLLSGGSNMVLTEDLQGLVMHMAILGKQWLQPSELNIQVAAATPKDQESLCYLKVGAGEDWDELVAWSLSKQAYGLQNLSLIPGLVGAAPVQNIGAYGAELAHVLHELEVYDFATGEYFSLSAKQCEFGYRDSVFKRQPSWIIINVVFVLSRVAKVQVNYGDMATYIKQHFSCEANTATPQQVRAAVMHIRSSKLPNPAEIPNVGSFFKNPVVDAAKAEQMRQRWPNIVAFDQSSGEVKLAAGWLIDQRGWKGYLNNGVGVHQNQALVLIRQPGANNLSTGKTLLGLAKDIQADVMQYYDVELEVEPRIFAANGEIEI